MRSDQPLRAPTQVGSPKNWNFVWRELNNSPASRFFDRLIFSVPRAAAARGSEKSAYQKTQILASYSIPSTHNPCFKTTRDNLPE